VKVSGVNTFDDTEPKDSPGVMLMIHANFFERDTAIRIRRVQGRPQARDHLLFTGVRGRVVLGASR